MKRIAWLSLLVGMLSAGPLHASTLYYNNFDSPATLGLGASLTYTPGGAFVNTAIMGPYANFLENRTNAPQLTEFLFSNLPTHTSVDLGFILAFMDSWDSYNGGCCSPDNMDLYIDG